MAATITVDYISQLSILETFTGEVSPADNTITINGLDENLTLTAATDPPVTKKAVYTLTLSSGTGSIDLTALPGLTADETVDGTGLKVQFFKFKTPDTNANNITITRGASNGYGLGSGGAAWTVVLPPDSDILYKFVDTNPDIASGARLLDVTGTGSQVVEVAVVMG